MDMKAFSDENVARCTAPNGFNHPLDGWSLSDWMVATIGELGEAANVLKKINRVRDDIPGNSETPEQLKQMFADELADTYVYLDLTARSVGYGADWFDIAPPFTDPERTISDHMVLACACLGRAGVLGLNGLTPEFGARLHDTGRLLRLIAQQADIDLQQAIRSKFDRTSAKIGYAPDRLRPRGSDDAEFGMVP